MTTTALDRHDVLDRRDVLDLHDDQGGLDSGPSLAADPWATDWSLPSDVELKAVGWPGARPTQAASSDASTAAREPQPAVDNQIAEPTNNTPATQQLERPPAPLA